MFLKCSQRRKNGKTHRSWSIVESRRHAGGKITQQHVLYLGEINDSQQRAWEKTISVFDEAQGATRQLALFPADRVPPADGTEAVQVRLDELRLEQPRQWGACWLGDHLWRQLRLDDFFGARLPLSREGPGWEKVLRILAIYRLLSPGSEWRGHRHGFATTALGDLLGVDERAVQDATLSRWLDLLLPQKEELFGHLRQRWSDLFGARYEVLLYDLTPTYRPPTAASCCSCAAPNRVATSSCCANDSLSRSRHSHRPLPPVAEIGLSLDCHVRAALREKKSPEAGGVRLSAAQVPSP